MKKTIIITSAAALLGLSALTACKSDDEQSSTSTGPTTASAAKDCPGKRSFTQQAVVFDVLTLCATADVPTDKLSYAANVAAEWLDNDSDGVADEPRIIEAMRQNMPVVIMTPTGPSNALFRDLESDLNDRVIQDLSGAETNPSGGRRDASQEEIHHVIANSGWFKAFPEIFNDTPSAKLYGQWQLAERHGNYSYNDPTCDAACKVTEFFYLATAAYLGSAADLASDEMQLKNRDELAAALPATVSMMTSTSYNYPTDHWPNGNYAFRENIKLN
ncbi:hypothetical protein [Aliiroseovarius sp. 2305UL8-7]|uniref:hypothetical protein n=1 Tax=Aliiroseovarius conchicola TaxID=3121637 RepID=UPI0035275186